MEHLRKPTTVGGLHRRRTARKTPLWWTVRMGTGLMFTVMLLVALSLFSWQQSGYSSPENSHFEKRGLAENYDVQYARELNNMDAFNAEATPIPSYIPVNTPVPTPPIVESSDECDEVRGQADPCTYLENSDCNTGGLIPYLNIYYCSFSSAGWIAIIGFLLLLLLWFYLLGTTAEDYFCPTLAIISDVLRLDPDVAGITILALGNGAPDVFSTFVAITGSAGLDIALGELTGAGAFVSLVVVGAVTIASVAKVEAVPLIRDVSFYLVGAVAVFILCFVGKMYWWTSSLLLLYYSAYVGFTVIMNYAKKFRKPKDSAETDTLWDKEDDEILDKSYVSSTMGGSDNDDGFVIVPDENTLEQMAPEEVATAVQGWPERKELKRGFVAAVLELGKSVITYIDWGEKEWWEKLIFPFVGPLKLVLNVTIPLVEEETYHRLNYTLNPICAPLIIMLAIPGAYSLKIGGVVPLWAIVEPVGVILAIIVFFTTRNYQRPNTLYNYLFVAIAFFMSIIWIYLIANELVSLLESIGLIFDISEALLGMTVLAWGNSVGDMVADVVVARQGYPAMGIAACFGGPLFNMMIGLGVSITYQSLVGDYPCGYYPVQIQTGTLIAFVTLIISLLSTLIVIPITKFTFTRPYAAYTLLIYAIFTVVNILTLPKLNIIKPWCYPQSSCDPSICGG